VITTFFVIATPYPLTSLPNGRRRGSNYPCAINNSVGRA
jgi:hypothetical protein